ncbi:MAG TPA: sugar phosphate isomerase/epimerase [Planctomycetota bacterium]
MDTISRRTFMGQAAAVAALPYVPARKIKLGFDNFAVRAMGWKAEELLDYAAAQKVDVLFITDLDAYKSLDEAHLKDVKKKADDLGIQIYAGSWSICPTSSRFKNTWGSAEEHLRLVLKVAKLVGSPVARVILGSGEDRVKGAGIEEHIAATVKVCKAVKAQAVDSGVKIAIENHAGDLQGWELAGLIEEAGKDYVGANFDAGNAVWALEDPVANLETLGAYGVSNSLRDSAVWETPEGCVVQWTAVGDGQVDWKAYMAKYAELCPNVPFVIETISGFNRGFPYLKPEFWKPWGKVRGHEFARFVAFAKRGKPRDAWKPPAGVDRKKADQDFQKADLERSLAYCRETLGLGTK